MITEGAFWTSVNTAKLLGKKLDIVKDIQVKKGIYSSSFFGTMHSDDYRKIYDISISNSDWEILLKDESFFQFSYRKNEYSLSLYPRPTNFVTYDEWLTSLLLDEMDVKPEEFDKAKEELIGDSDMNSEYEQYLIEAENLKTIVPIRFDYDGHNYNQIYHPLCHLHVGINNNIRIATDKFMTPLMFFHFIIKNYFPDTFFYRDKKGIMQVNPIITLPKKTCVSVPTKLFENEELLLHFT